MGSAQSTYLSASHAQQERRKKQAEKFANSRRGQKALNSKRAKKYAEKRERELQEGANLRKAQEEDNTKGERVWFSRCILNGRLAHWVMMTHGMKYELRRKDHLQQPAGSGDEQYVCNIKEYTIDQEKRDLALTKLLLPDVDGYYVCLIGWTQMSKDQVGDAARQVMAGFGQYSLLRNNCQDFLRGLAERILIHPKAADYEWFMSNTKTKYQKDQWLMPPPAEMMLRNMERLMQQQQMQQVQIQNQIQQQQQQQMQIQLQQQLQNQIQMQMMQTQMMQNNMMGGGAGM